MTALRSVHSPKQIAIQLFEAVKMLDLGSAQNEAVDYAALIVENPQLVRPIREMAGKTVHVIAHIEDSSSLDAISIRGNLSPLDWNSAYPQDASSDNPLRKTFTFVVSANDSNQILEFKLCKQVMSDKSWSSGPNWKINLNRYHSFAKIEIKAVKFD